MIKTDTRAMARIWAGSEGGAGWYYGYWDLDGQSDYNDRCEYIRADLYEAERERAEKAEKVLQDLIENGPHFSDNPFPEPGLQQLTLYYYLNWYGSKEAKELSEKYIAALSNKGDGDE